MNCKYCKMEVPEGYRYCPNCGLLLDLGKQFTAPERKYTIPKYEYRPKKAEAEAAAPETTQQFLQPQHEESTEEAEARLELELRKALERDARALAAEKKPTEAVEFSDEDYAQVEQDDTPDAIELEEKQSAEPLLESVTLEAASETAVDSKESEGSEQPERADENTAAEESDIEAAPEPEANEDEAEALQKPDAVEDEPAVAQEPNAVEAEAKAIHESGVIEAAAETVQESAEIEETEPAAEVVTAEAAEISETEDDSVTEDVSETEDVSDASEATAESSEAEAEETAQAEVNAAEGQDIVCNDAYEAENQLTAAEAVVETEVQDEAESEATGQESVAPESSEAADTASETDTQDEKQPAAVVTETVEQEVNESLERPEVESEPSGEEEAEESAEAEAEDEKNAEASEADQESAAETEACDEPKNTSERYSDLEEKLAALLPDDGLDSTKVDEQGNPAFVWDESISFMEAVSEKSVGDFKVEADKKPAEKPAAARTEAEKPDIVEEPKAAEQEATASEVEDPVDAGQTEAEAEPSAETEGIAADAESDMTAEKQEKLEISETDNVAETEESEAPEVSEESVTGVEEPEAATEIAEASEIESAETEVETGAAAEEYVDAAEIGYEQKHRRRTKRFLIPLAVCAVAAGAIVVYLNLPAQRMSRALSKGRNYVESNNFTAAVPVLEKLLQSQPDSLEVHLLLADAYANTDQHAQAVALLEEAKAAYPDNAELLEKLAELNPTVSVSVPSGDYSDPQSIELSNEKGYEIRYQLNDEPEQTYDDEILLSTNGEFTLSAYAVAADGAKGESVSMNYNIQLDPEKYPLDQFVDTAEGRQYIDADGAVQTGWMTKDDKTYYFDEKGYMLTGLQTIEDSTYFFDADGVLSTGWQQQDGKHYFFDEKGRMLTNTWIDNQYYVGEDGAMLTDTTTPDGVYVNARGQKGFDAASEFANYPNSIVQAHIGTKVDKGDYYEVSASVYHQKSDNKPTGESYDITLKVLKHAKVHYIDNNLPDIIASDAFSFLKEIGMQKIQQDDDGYVTEFSFALGEKRS